MSHARSVRSVALVLGIACALLPRATWGALSLAGSNCPHIRVLEKQDAGQVSQAYREKIDNPGSAQLRVLGKAVNMLSPLLCQAVRRVAFVDLAEEPGVIGFTMADEDQDLVYLNSAREASWSDFRIDQSPRAQAGAIQNFVHESTHAAVRLLQSQQDTGPPQGEFLGVRIKLMQKLPDPSLWSERATDRAKGIVEEMDLGNGVIREWVRLHESFRARGLAGEYYGEAWDDQVIAESDHARNGFSSAYGGQSPLEDIAELTGWAVSRRVFVAGAKSAYGDRACDALRSHAGGIPDALAAVQAKLEFLLHMGFIDERSYRACTGTAGQ